jgi:hypothetical protein
LLRYKGFLEKVVNDMPAKMINVVKNKKLKSMSYSQKRKIEIKVCCILG